MIMTMMIRNFIFFILLLAFNFNQAQTETLERFPLGQDFYVRGRLGILQDMSKIAKDLNLEACENTDANIQIDILVYPDATIKYVKMPDEDYIENNRCAYDFGKKIIPHLSRWLPAKLNGESVLAMTKVIVDPFMIVHSKENVSENIVVEPQFKGGLSLFQKQIQGLFYKAKFSDAKQVRSISFTVNQNGAMENFEIDGDYDAQKKDLLIAELLKIKGTWEPGTFNGIPKSFKFNQKITFEKLEKDNLLSQDDFHSVIRSW